MYVDRDRHPDLLPVALRQCGVMLRTQLRDCGVPRSYVAHQITAARWTAWGSNLILLQNSQWNRRQSMWMAVLETAGVGALGSHTSLELAGFRPFAQEANEIHLLVPRGAKPTDLPGVRVHESRRLEGSWLEFTEGLPRTGTARSALDAAAWQRWPRFACLMVAAVVQQRVCTTDDLDLALAHAGRIRHKKYLRLAVADVAGGVESLGELDVGGLCRRHRLHPPRRQVARLDREGRRRYVDCEWTLPGGHLIVLEIDGSHHMDAHNWGDDLRRERSLVIGGATVLRATTYEVRLEAGRVACDLIAAGVPRIPDLSESQHARAC